MTVTEPRARGGLRRARGQGQPLAPTTGPLPTGRIPRGGRERRPALAVLAVLLIAAGALVSGLLVLRTGNRTEVLEIAKPVGAGSVVTADDLATVEVAAPGGSVVPASQRGQVVGLTAATTLTAGSLLSASQLTAAAVPGPAQATYGLKIAAGQVPQGVNAGDTVEVISTASASAGGSRAPFPSGTAVVPAASVYRVSGDVTDGYIITLVVSRSQALDLATASTFTGGVTLAKIGGH